MRVKKIGLAKALSFVMALLILSGCGESGGSPQQPQTAAAVKDAYRSWNEMVVKGKVGQSCSMMTKHLLDQLLARERGRSSTCKQLITLSAAYAKRNPEMLKYKISDVVVTGDKATLIDETPVEGRISTSKMTLLRVKGRWMVDSSEDIEIDAPKAAVVAYRNYFEAIFDGNAAAACKLASARAQRILIQLGAQSDPSVTTCKTAIPALKAIVTSVPRPTIVGGESTEYGVVINVDQSTNTGQVIKRSVYMTYEDGRWKFDYSIDGKRPPTAKQPSGDQTS